MLRFYIFLLVKGSEKKMFGVSAERFSFAHNTMVKHLEGQTYDTLVLAFSVKTPETYQGVIELSNTEEE